MTNTNTRTVKRLYRHIVGTVNNHQWQTLCRTCVNRLRESGVEMSKAFTKGSETEASIAASPKCEQCGAVRR